MALSTAVGIFKGTSTRVRSGDTTCSGCRCSLFSLRVALAARLANREMAGPPCGRCPAPGSIPSSGQASCWLYGLPRCPGGLMGAHGLKWVSIRPRVGETPAHHPCQGQTLLSSEPCVGEKTRGPHTGLSWILAQLCPQLAHHRFSATCGPACCYSEKIHSLYGKHAITMENGKPAALTTQRSNPATLET